MRPLGPLDDHRRVVPVRRHLREAVPRDRRLALDPLPARPHGGTPEIGATTWRRAAGYSGGVVTKGVATRT
ncbi:MAG: hypothetical protein QOG87_3685, partial [Actinomycetota bacterium]